MRYNNIVLIGFMGCGKTTIGRRLTEVLNFTFIDADEVIEIQEEKSVADIFRINGETYFRELETGLLKTWASQLDHYVISTGGGMVLKAENAQLMKALGWVVYLKTSPDEIAKRLVSDTSRPLLAGEERDSKVLKIKSLLEERNAYYEAAAHTSILTDEKSINTIVKEIEGYYEKIKSN